MKANLTDLTIILDRSGSMKTIQAEAENGLNHMVDEQKKLPGDCLLTLCQFDTVYEFVVKGMNLKSPIILPRFKLEPRGMTALLDAVGRCIVETGERLSQMSEEERPGLVVFVIITDGAENSSREYTKEAIQKMIEHQKSAYQWQFTFLGANQDAFAEAGGIGIQKTSALQYVPQNAQAAFCAGSANVGRMRGMAAFGQPVKSGYTDEERKAATK